MGAEERRLRVAGVLPNSAAVLRVHLDDGRARHPWAMHAVVEDLDVAVIERGCVVLVVNVRRAVLPDELPAGVDEPDAAVAATGEENVARRRHVEAVRVRPLQPPLERADRVAPRVQQLPEADTAHLLAPGGGLAE